MIQHPLQIATEKILTIRRFRTPRQGPFWIIGRITISKAFRKDLIPNRPFNPFRCFKAIDFMKIRHAEIIIGHFEELLRKGKNTMIAIKDLSSIVSLQKKTIG